jgi:hypothetical protein
MNTLPERNKHLVYREQVVPGLIVYEVMVYGYEGIMQAMLPKKLEVVSDIINTQVGSYTTSHVQSKNCATGELEKEKSYLGDRSVFPRGEFKPRNMHRWFHTVEAALAYANYVNKSGFKDKKKRNYDETYYVGTSYGYDPIQGSYFVPSMYSQFLWHDQHIKAPYSWSGDEVPTETPRAYSENDWDRRSQY